MQQVRLLLNRQLVSIPASDPFEPKTPVPQPLSPWGRRLQVWFVVPSNETT